MALVMIYTVLLHFDHVAKFTVTHLNKDFINTGWGHRFTDLNHRIYIFKQELLLPKDEKSCIHCQKLPKVAIGCQMLTKNFKNWKM